MRQLKVRDSATLVRGKDTHGNFDLEPTPKHDLDAAALAAHKDAADPEYRKDMAKKQAEVIAAVKACMMQLDEVEAFADEQEAALLSDRGQLATLSSVRVCLACGADVNNHLASCRTRQAGDIL